MSWAHFLVLAVVGLFVFGPERLPTILRDAGGMLRQLRQMTDGVRDDLRSELGPEFADLDLQSLHPKTLIEQLGENEEPAEPARTSPKTSLNKTTPPPTTRETPPYDHDAT